MTEREVREQCYFDMLEDSIVSVESVLNQLHKLEAKKGVIDKVILHRDRQRTFCDLELSLAMLCILLRKMQENQFIVIPEGLRKDINSIIHSNKMKISSEGILLVYSQKGEEDVYPMRLLKFAKGLFKH